MNYSSKENKNKIFLTDKDIEILCLLSEEDDIDINTKRQIDFLSKLK